MVGQNLKHYTVEAVLGKGGMGTVYRARDTRLQRPVALKVLTADLTSDSDRKSRFLQEARAAAAITHPAIAQVYDVDEADGVTFIAMELVEGQTVRQLVTAHDLDLISGLEVAIQVGEGLARAHETGIVHRDIKSENIMVTRDGHAKILDFGLAKLNPLHNVSTNSGAEEHMSQMATVAQTQAGMVVGTLAYMSPEQARGRSVDHRSDIFSLGVTLYEMITGQLPFSGQSPLDTMHAIAFEETRPVTSIRQNLPPEAHRIISRCLRKRPEDRYPDAKALVDDLKALKKDMDSGVTRAVPVGDRLREQLESFKHLKPATLAWIAGGAVLLILTLLLLSTGRSGGLWPLFGLVGIGLLVYRRIKNRPQKMLKRFADRIGKLPEVKLISCQQNKILVVVDRAQAKIYVRVNSMLESVNRKIIIGDHMTVAVRDDVPQDELRRILQQPGVLYVHDDLFV